MNEDHESHKDLLAGCGTSHLTDLLHSEQKHEQQLRAEISECRLRQSNIQSELDLRRESIEQLRSRVLQEEAARRNAERRHAEEPLYYPQEPVQRSEKLIDRMWLRIETLNEEKEETV